MKVSIVMPKHQTTRTARSVACLKSYDEHLVSSNFQDCEDLKSYADKSIGSNLQEAEGSGESRRQNQLANSWNNHDFEGLKS